MIASKLLLHEDSYSHRVWPQRKAGQKLHFRGQRMLSSPLCLFPPHLGRSTVAPLPHERQMCAGIPFYICIFLTWRARQQTGVRRLCLFHPHTAIGMLLSAKSLCVWVWGRSTAPREPIAGHRCEAGGGGCRPIREPRRNSLWNRDQPTDRDTTQLRGCSAADKLYSLFFLNPLSASSNPFLFVVNLMQFLQMNLLIQVVTKANKAQTLLVWGSICKQVVCSLIANRLDSHKCDNMKDLWLLELRNERSVW